ncbi:TonB-dependent receptor [Arsukibacterium ikkense]|uniref:TonB-dependent receptor n=1 Tax=Arsukibacterium ikkense TaxID=336831 RepID=A0A0M2V2J9_9GAMM|nr:TonB-dependent receptor [Arsukibacterium ikkense]KKO45087.1 TonB-dependent receptor [Arsukibacterium ikkense]
MKNFKLNMLTVALIAAGASSAAVAQQSAEAAEQAKEDAIEVIAVTGYRGSLQRAQAIKMSESSVVEVLSAEDIGKLPDTSIAESLARLPGLAGERRNGRTSGLSVRGFNENYVGTSLNGRELLGMGDNRGVEYDLYPSEIVSTAVVYKTPDATVLAQGIGGTIDLQTIRPLTAESTLTFNANFEQNDYSSGNPDFDNKGHRFSINFVDKFLNDTVGVALVVSSMETPRQEQQFRGWGYADVNLNRDANGNFENPRRATDTVAVPAGTVVLGGHDSFTRSAMLERDSFAAIIEFMPSDKLTVKFDALYIDFVENDIRRGLEEGGAEWGTGAYTITGVENGLVTSGYYDGFHSVVRNDARRQEADLLTFGLNLEYELSDDWSAQLDLSSGKVEKTITDVESYSGVGRAGIDGRPLAARSWTMTPTGVMYSDHPSLPSVDYTNASLMRLAGPQGWGGALGAIPQFAGSTNAQDGFVNQPEFEETLDSIRLQLNGFVNWGIITGIETGLVYQERSKTKINNGAFLTAPSWPGDVAIPNPLGVADLSFIGIAGVTAYDSLGLYNSGYYIETDAALLENGRFGDTYKIDEKLTTAFAKFDLNTEVAGMMVQGNFGLQVVNAKQSGQGFSTTSNAQGFTVATPVSDSDSYTDILPTLNLSVEVADRQYVRTALSKVISRPRMDDMRPNAQVTFQFNDGNILSNDPANSPWGGSAGNTKLKPLEANQFDIAYENYYHDNGFFAASFFFKDLKNWHRNETVIADFSDVYIPGFHQSSNETGNLPPVLFVGGLSRVTDGLQGFVRGYEFQASLPFEILHQSLDGFGIVASATFMDGKLDDGGRVPGLSNEIYTLTAYYEYKGFEFRISGTKRDEFLSETRGLSLSLATIEDRGAELWDAQIGYDFSESGIAALDGLRVTFQVQNITDEPTLRTNGADARQVTDYQSFGRNFMLGLNYKF